MLTLVHCDIAHWNITLYCQTTYFPGPSSQAKDWRNWRVSIFGCLFVGHCHIGPFDIIQVSHPFSQDGQQSNDGWWILDGIWKMMDDRRGIVPIFPIYFPCIFPVVTLYVADPGLLYKQRCHYIFVSLIPWATPFKTCVYSLPKPKQFFF